MLGILVRDVHVVGVLRGAIERRKRLLNARSVASN